MATITENLRLAIREFKSRINGFNFVIDFEEPPFPIGSTESYQAQLELANEYLKKYPELRDEEFDTLGLPIDVQRTMTQNLELHRALQKRNS